MTELSVKETAALLAQKDNILILCHMKPDGDTLGAGIALLRALRALGKQARAECADGFPPRYAFLWEGLDMECQPDFVPAFVVAVDVADTVLLGKPMEQWKQGIDLCIDHHPSNGKYAAYLLLEPSAAATAQIMRKVIAELTPLTPEIALCLYTGLATDTGCFRYSNTSAETLYAAAEMVGTGIDSATVNKQLFETKSAGRLELERRVLETLEYHLDGRVALMTVAKAVLEETGVPEADLDGLSGLPKQIEGVEIGITLKEAAAERYRVSVRTGMGADASGICARFGGGGHARAAGCFLRMPLEDAKRAMVEASAAALTPQTKV